MTRLGHTQSEVAERLGIGQATMCRWIDGTQAPRVNDVESMSWIAEYCGVRLETVGAWVLASHRERDERRFRDAWSRAGI